jgi:nicotinamidase-related amidase
MNRRIFLALPLAGAAFPAAGRTLKLHLRTRVELFKGSGEWQEVAVTRDFPIASTAMLVCDMWDKHWCSGATIRVAAMAPKIAALHAEARKQGILIVHSPSDVMAFYKDSPQRKLMEKFGAQPLEKGLSIEDPPLPIDDSKGGCDTGDTFYKAWSRQHPAIPIAAGDAISDKGVEIYPMLRSRGITNVLVMGVHTNMCVLNRSFAIKQMTRLGMHCVLVRDLTDAMYDPKAKPFVSHDRGTQLVIEHIEKYWCPSVLSTDISAALSA